MKKTIVLYNPAAPYFTLPLQFLALAAMIDRDRFNVVIIDARIEKNLRLAHRKVRELLPDALCVGISVITGTPIRDAVDVTALVRQYAPSVPIVWGGWHPSVFPGQCLAEGGADICVLGQGELTFREVVDALDARTDLAAIRGIVFKDNGRLRTTDERPFADINQFPPYDYGLLPLEEYFRLKGQRQLDFYSSQGCPYRCAFCADPFVYRRRWSGLSAPRMMDDVFRAAQHYGVNDVVFHDENFFANRHRVAAFCEAMALSTTRFSWTATSRADQIAPLEDVFLATAARAGLRKVVIGAESGSQELLNMMTKDTLTEETIISAEKLARHRIGAAFGFIVGFPEETFSDTLQTLDTIKEIKRIDPTFDFNIFFYTPYPGTELFEMLVRRHYPVPQSLAAWSDIDFIRYAGPWVRAEERSYVERFKFYTKVGTEPGYSTPWKRPLQMAARARLEHSFFKFPIEKEVVNFVRHKVLHRFSW